MIKQIYILSNGYAICMGDENSPIYSHNLITEFLDHLISIGEVDEETVINVNHETTPMKNYHEFHKEIENGK